MDNPPPPPNPAPNPPQRNRHTYIASVKAVLRPPDGTMLLILIAFATIMTLILIIVSVVLPWFGHSEDYQSCCTNSGHTSWVFLLSPLANAYLLPIIALLFSHNPMCTRGSSISTTFIYVSFFIFFIACFSIFIANQSHRGSWQIGAYVLVIAYVCSAVAEILQCCALFLAVTHYNIQQAQQIGVPPAPEPVIPTITITIKDTASPLNTPRNTPLNSPHPVPIHIAA